MKSLAIEPVEEKAWNDSTAYAIKSYFRVGKISMTARTISQMLEMLMTVSVIWLGASLVFDHVLSIGALIAFQMLSGRVTGPLVRLVGLIHEYQQVALSVRMLGVVMNTPVEPAGGGVRNPLKGNISFENVTFQYRPDTPQVIRNLDLDVPVGSTIGIVGRSGSGKTTLTKLAARFWDIQQGKILLGGEDISQIDPETLLKNYAIVFQDVVLFNASIKDNIRIGKKGATDEEVTRVAKIARCDEFIDRMPDGIDTVIGENGERLSGGERQRISIARALLKDAPIILMDEATASLDVENESLIQEALSELIKEKTVIVIAHRMRTIRGANKIVLLHQGKIEAMGTDAELQVQSATYRKMLEKSMG